MLEINPINVRMWSKLGARGTFGVAMLDLAGREDDVIGMTSDLAITSGLDRFQNTYPEKFVNVGIAEQNMVGIAAGMAKEENVVFATTFATFATMRSYEQVRLHLGYMQFNVKLVGLASGFAMGMFGNTHYGIEDIALMRAVPGLTVLSPADGAEIVKCVNAAYDFYGPIYIRLTGAMNNPIVYKEEFDFQIGKAILLRSGVDVTIIATGTMVHEAMEAAKILETNHGINATVLDMHTIKPLDKVAIDEACARGVPIVSIEEHSVVGGLGGAIAEYKARLSNSPRQIFIGVENRFDKAGDYKYLLENNGLTAELIAKRIVVELSKK